MTPLSSLSLETWLDALAGPRAVPAGGALALVTLAGASSLAAKVSRARGRDAASFEGLARGFLRAAAEDADSYARAVTERGDALAACLEAGLRHVEAAADLREALGQALGDLPSALAADLAAAEGLSRAGARALLVNFAVNLSEWSEAVGDPARLEALRRGLEAARARLEGR